MYVQDSHSYLRIFKLSAALEHLPPARKHRYQNGSMRGGGNGGEGAF